MCNTIAPITVSDLGTIKSSKESYKIVKDAYKDVNCGLITTILLDHQNRLTGIYRINGEISDAWIKINDYASSMKDCSGVVVVLTKNEGKRSDFPFADSLLSLKNALRSSDRKLIDVLVCGTDCYYSYYDDKVHKVS